MVLFNELRITENGDGIDIGCFVEDLEIYSKMYIKRVLLEYYVNALPSGEPSNKAIVLYENAEDIETIRAVNVHIDASDEDVKKNFGISSFSGGIFYAIVECDGTLSASTSSMSCGYDEARDTGVILDWRRLYADGMRHIAGMNLPCGDRCRDEGGFDAFVVTWNALRLAIASCDYRFVERIWTKYLRQLGAGSQAVSGCGCGK